MIYPKLPMCFNTLNHSFEHDILEPCLKWAASYDCGIGYLTPDWFMRNIPAMNIFAANGGEARWIVCLEHALQSSIWSCKDCDGEYQNDNLSIAITSLIEGLSPDILNILAWLLYDNILELRLVYPNKGMGAFPVNFGIFQDNEENEISFNGFLSNNLNPTLYHDRIKLFKSWEGMAHYIQTDKDYFCILWSNSDEALSVRPIDQQFLHDIIIRRTNIRPYSLNNDKSLKLWPHQKQAVDIFMKNKKGILEMATGTGKTRVALEIINRLEEEDLVDTIIITMYGNDLLSQWYKEIMRSTSRFTVYRYYGDKHRELTGFLLCKTNRILLITREAESLKNCFSKLIERNSNILKRTLLLFEEVHGLGSASLRKALSGICSRYDYRLGLSATPEREYDEEGNAFIAAEVGPILYTYSLEQAIRDGILCEFDYSPLAYELTSEEKQKKQSIIASFHAKNKNGHSISESELYRDLAQVNKTSVGKIPVFNSYLKQSSAILQRCIIFVETREYGLYVQKSIIQYNSSFHTYYGEDDAHNLERFASGHLDCLITCKKISEGIDIQSVNNIILFSSDRSKLTTIQRIGRSLRINRSNLKKRAHIIDFICMQGSMPDEAKYSVADEERKDWLCAVAKTRRFS